MSWKKIKSTSLLSHPRLAVTEDEVLLPDGTSTNYLRYEGGGDYATIIAINRLGEFALIKEYAYPSDRVLIQFPEGLLDPNETPETGASRELAEEIGYQAGSLNIIGRNLAHHRRSTAINHIAVADELEQLSEKLVADAEEKENETIWMTEEAIWVAIANGDIIQKNTLAAWAIYQSKNR